MSGKKWREKTLLYLGKVLGGEDPLEKGMATLSSILAWRIPMDRGAWRATHSPWVRKESDTTEQLSTAHEIIYSYSSLKRWRCDLLRLWFLWEKEIVFTWGRGSNYF